MKLSILIPSIPSRLSMLKDLLEELDRQSKGLDVEILALSDNCKRQVGIKRNSLMQMAKGQYITHLDDDDFVAPDYIETILDCINNGTNPDVICFKSRSYIDDEQPFIVSTSLAYENEESRYVDANAKLRNNIRRKPWHWCVWKNEIALKGSFPSDFYFGEDWHWLQQVIPLCVTETIIDKELHIYRHKS